MKFFTKFFQRNLQNRPTNNVTYIDDFPCAEEAKKIIQDNLNAYLSKKLAKTRNEIKKAVKNGQNGITHVGPYEKDFFEQIMNIIRQEMLTKGYTNVNTEQTLETSAVQCRRANGSYYLKRSYTIQWDYETGSPPLYQKKNVYVV